MDFEFNRTRHHRTMLPFYPYQAYIFTFILSILFVFGLFANAVTFFVIARTKLRKSTFNIFLMSLCVSDFLSALFSPIFIYRRTWGYETWHIPRLFCKFFFGIDQWTSVVTAAHITTFSLLRLISVRWPHAFGKINACHAKITVSSLWAISFFIGFIPFFMFCGIVEKIRNAPKAGGAWPACSLLISWIPSFKIYAYVGYPIFFYAPIVCVTVISITISILLWKRRRIRLRHIAQTPRAMQLNGAIDKRLRKDRQALAQLTLIVASFLLGYVPHIVYHFYTTNTVHTTQYMRNVDWVFGMVEYTCLRFSECMNPVIYNLSSSKIRKQTLLMISNCRNFKVPMAIRPRKRSRGTGSLTPENGIAMQSTSRSSLSPPR
ncbi:growth hormone secretagogue receptor type 1-like isoform X2 [Styela clava]|uniref:growth hormone secretagogue receptor type 1-like isoform X2 n=1 Tax=Styela clava TaxID=7725 RepID=UPI001939FF13|nr:growth hormone secretagogue receptor type 1-like isoform X2 [Styela clava]